MKFRIGLGYDVHQFADGRKLILGGLEIPYDRGLKGHSDADVLLHSIADAFLGAASLGDIGTHFPDTDPRFKDADSSVLLQQVIKMIASEGYEVGNVDATIVAEEPKMSPHIPSMKERISELLECEPGDVSIKATTHEKMGAIGRLEGIAVHSVVLIKRK